MLPVGTTKKAVKDTYKQKVKSDNDTGKKMLRGEIGVATYCTLKVTAVRSQNPTKSHQEFCPYSQCSHLNIFDWVLLILDA